MQFILSVALALSAVLSPIAAHPASAFAVSSGGDEPMGVCIKLCNLEKPNCGDLRPKKQGDCWSCCTPGGAKGADGISIVTWG